MADDRGERTEAPTPRRRQEAREQGQVARSQDLPAAVLLLGTVVALHVLAPHILDTLLETYTFLLGNDAARPQEVTQLLPLVLKSVALVTLPILLLGVVFVVVANLAQVGWTVSTEPLVPDLNRLNPVSGLGKLFDLQALVRLGMGILKMFVVAAVAVLTIWQVRHGVLNSAHLGVGAMLGYSGQIVYTLCLRLAIALLILAVIDYAWQRWKHEQDLKMTKEEIKEEFRRMEGDPMVKHRRRQVQQQLAQQRMRYDVPKADVVITNPTELAIAIKYDADTMAAPRVVAKGQGYMAAMIRQIAAEHGVPIVERKPLARALYKIVEVGEEIPREFYKAIAEVLAYVYEITQRGYRRRPISA
jgi:flagellar biosynthesis protein FlhB